MSENTQTDTANTEAASAAASEAPNVDFAAGAAAFAGAESAEILNLLANGEGGGSCCGGGCCS